MEESTKIWQPLEASMQDSGNRVADAIYLYAEQEAQYKISNPINAGRDLEAVALKRQYYRNILAAYKRKPNPAEKITLRYLRRQIRRMNARLRPTLLKRIRYSGLGNTIGNAFSRDRRIYSYYDKITQDIQKRSIESHNLNALSTSLKKAGFKLSVDGSLQKMLKQNLPDFHIRYADIYSKGADFVLHFKKIPGSDIYYFEKFQAISRPSLDALLNNDPSSTRHTFHVHDRMNFTAQEAAALVNGRSVNKMIERQENWLMLDLTHSHNPQFPFKATSFDLEKELKKLPLKPLSPSHFEGLMQALKSGLTKEVTLQIQDKPVKFHLQAAPFQNTIHVMDDRGSIINLPKLNNQFTTAAKITQMKPVWGGGTSERPDRSTIRRV